MSGEEDRVVEDLRAVASKGSETLATAAMEPVFQSWPLSRQSELPC